MDIVPAKFDCIGTQGAVINAGRTGVAVSARAAFEMPFGGAHIDEPARHIAQRSAGAFFHADEGIAHHAGLDFRVNIGESAAVVFSGVELDGVGRADGNAVTASATDFEEFVLCQCPRWSQYGQRNPGCIVTWRGRFGASCRVVEFTEFLGQSFDRGDPPFERLGERLQQFE